MNAFVRIAVAAGALLAAQPALAGSDLSPADLNALKSYSLSMDKVKAMQVAMDEAQKAGMENKMSASSDSKSLAEMEAKLKAMPGAMTIFARHGLTAHDVAVMPFVLMDAGMCVLYPAAAPKLADRTSPAQIAFYKQHQADLKKIKWLSGG
jgi:hypothetical protein